MSPACWQQVPVTFFLFAKAKWKNVFTFSQKHQDVFQMFLQLLQILEEAFELAFRMSNQCLLKQGFKTHVTHCTDALTVWISTLPGDMCLFFSCHRCHSISKWHQWHRIFAYIARWCVENQSVAILVQWVTWVFEPWKRKGGLCLLINKKGCKNATFASSGSPEGDRTPI